MTAILGLILLAFASGAAAAAYYVRHWAYQQGYRDGACDLEDTKADVADLEERFYALSTQRRAAA